MSLLERSGLSAPSKTAEIAPVQTVNKLALPPMANFQAAGPRDAGDDPDETNLGADVPSLVELANQTLPGIDTSQTAAALEQDIAIAKVSPAVQWRGKISDDGVDITNISGVLCTGTDEDHRGSITLACSDGRVARLQFAGPGQTSKVFFGKLMQQVELLN